MHMHLVPLLAAAFSCPLAAVAQPVAPRPISFEGALAGALAHHPTVVAARHELAATEGGLQQSAMRPNPTVAWEVEDTRRDTRVTTVLLSQPIELGGKRASRMAAAGLARDLAAAQLAAAEGQVRAGVASAYADALIAQQRVTLAQTSLALAEAGTRAAARRVTAGKVSPVDETRARVAEAGVRLELLQALSEQRTALQALRAATALPPAAFDAVEGSLAPVPEPLGVGELRQQVQASPPVRKARLDADRLAALAELERARRTPDLTVSVGARRDAESGRNMAVVGMSVPLPLFDTQQGAALEAARRADKAAADAQAAVLNVESDALQARERLLAARAESAALQNDVLPGAQAAYDAAVKGFELGKFGVLDVLDAQRTLLLAQGQSLRVWAEAQRARIELERLLGPSVSHQP